MQRATIRKSVTINAPRERVWDVLLGDRYTRVWYAAFHEGSKAEGDWTRGSQMRFTEPSGSGLLSRVLEHVPAERLVTEHVAVLAQGKEDRESESAREWIGCREMYSVEDVEGGTKLFIENDLPESFREMFTVLWDKALEKIKELAEGTA